MTAWASIPVPGSPRLVAAVGDAAGPLSPSPHPRRASVRRFSVHTAKHDPHHADSTSRFARLAGPCVVPLGVRVVS